MNVGIVCITQIINRLPIFSPYFNEFRIHSQICGETQTYHFMRKRTTRFAASSRYKKRRFFNKCSNNSGDGELNNSNSNNNISKY